MGMSKWIILVLVGVLAGGMVGCMSPPSGTTWTDTDANGIKDTLVLDENNDGQPDVD